MITEREDVVKQMTFYVEAPIDTVFNDIEKFGDIATVALNTYTAQKYVNLAYKIINKTGQYNIGLWQWNCKYTTEKPGMHLNHILARPIRN